MNRVLTKFALLALVVITMASVAVPAGAREKKQVRSHVGTTSTVSHLSYADSMRYSYFFLEAVRRQNAGHYAAAYDLLTHCLEIDSSAAEAYYMLAMYHSEMKRDSMALQCLETAARLRPDNDTYQEKVAQFYINMGNYAKATDAYERLYAAQRGRSDVLHILTQLYQQQNNYDAMLGAINRIEQIEGEDEQFALARMRVYEMKGDTKSAYKTLKRLADSHPNDLTYNIMLGNWLMQNKRQKEAYAIFEKALRAEPENSYAQSSMYDYYKSAGRVAEANEMMERILLGKNTPSENRAMFLRQMMQESEQQGDSTRVVQLLERMREAMPKDADVAEMKVAYYTIKKKPVEEINKALVDLLALEPDNGGARLQLIQNKWSGQDWSEIARLSEPGMLYNPDEMVFYYFTGLSRYYQKDDIGALDAFQRGTAEINAKSDPEIVSDFYAIMAEIYHNRGEQAKAYAAFDSCLQWKPDHLMTLNNYAYFLAIEGGDLKKAEEMSVRTVRAEPKNATYLDTYAWVLYCQNRYAEAKIYIDQAMTNSTDSTLSADVLEHAGDIYVKTGDAEGAAKMWQKAIDAGGDEAALTRKIKLNSKKKQ